MFRILCRAHSFSDIEPILQNVDGIFSASGVSRSPSAVVAIWYLSNGTDIALITYTSLFPDDPATELELVEAKGIAGSTKFRM
jgi:hypothetical protein